MKSKNGCDGNCDDTPNCRENCLLDGPPEDCVDYLKDAEYINKVWLLAIIRTCSIEDVNKIVSEFNRLRDLKDKTALLEAINFGSGKKD